jgi:hypothetical protein
MKLLFIASLLSVKVLDIAQGAGGVRQQEAGP